MQVRIWPKKTGGTPIQYAAARKPLGRYGIFLAGKELKAVSCHRAEFEPGRLLRLTTIHACYRQTDRQTTDDRQTAL